MADGVVDVLSDKRALARRRAYEAPLETQVPSAQVHPLDFSKPTKFTPEIRHRITAALTPALLWLGRRIFPSPSGLARVEARGAP